MSVEPEGTEIVHGHDFAYRPTRLVALFDREFRRLEAEVPPFSLQVRAALGDRGWSTLV